MSQTATDIVTYSFMVAAIFVLTKGTGGTNLVGALTTGFANIIKAATGQ